MRADRQGRSLITRVRLISDPPDELSHATSLFAIPVTILPTPCLLPPLLPPNHKKITLMITPHPRRYLRAQLPYPPRAPPPPPLPPRPSSQAPSSQAASPPRSSSASSPSAPSSWPPLRYTRGAAACAACHQTPSSVGICLLRSDGEGVHRRGERVMVMVMVGGSSGGADGEDGGGGCGRDRSARVRLSPGKRNRRCSTRGSRDDEGLWIP